ncbi:MAG: heavy-metal-associated domain-containing protein [Lachnospiraceae bacterium]|nr:heavy-metal-associated domain-containing protein [Lachnospiraceae bacterium]
MGNTIIIAALVLIIGIAVYSTVRRVRYGSSCCGEHDPKEKKVKVTDRNKSHYPYTYVLQVDGMHCSNCARRVENALNAGDGRWAVADVSKKEVTLYTKQEEDESELGTIIAKAGYTLLSCDKYEGGEYEKTI